MQERQVFHVDYRRYGTTKDEAAEPSPRFTGHEIAGHPQAVRRIESHTTYKTS